MRAPGHVRIRIQVLGENLRCYFWTGCQRRGRFSGIRSQSLLRYVTGCFFSIFQAFHWKFDETIDDRFQSLSRIASAIKSMESLRDHS